MSSLSIELPTVYFKVSIDEIIQGEKEKRGFRTYLSIKWSNVTFKVRKVRFIGRVADIVSRDKFTDLLVIDETGGIIVRGWDEKSNILNKFSINDLVEVFGTIRMFGEEVYINPIIIKRLLKDNSEKRKKAIEENRKYIIGFYTSEKLNAKAQQKEG